MQYLLHIDTSADSGMVAIGANGSLLAYRIHEGARNHASTINTMISAVIAEAGIALQQLSAIVVCAGPGSYTGLRIGLATAKGLCYALDKPLILDSKLTLLAYEAHRQYPGKAQYVAMLVAREKEYFISVYDQDFSCTLSPQHITADELNTTIKIDVQTLFITDADTATINNLMIGDNQVENQVNTPLHSWIFYAFEKYNCNEFVNLAEAEPFYLKQVYTHK